MIRELFLAMGVATLTFGCAVPKKVNRPEQVYKVQKESIQYNCYPGKHFAVVSYHDIGKKLRIDHWGKDRNAGCFGLYSVSFKDDHNKDILVLFSDDNCDGRHESIIDLSKKYFKGDLKKTFANILKDLRDRHRTQVKIKQCLGN